MLMTLAFDTRIEKSCSFCVFQLTYTETSVGGISIQRTCSPVDECASVYSETEGSVTIIACCDDDLCNTNLQGDTKIQSLDYY